MHTGIAQNHRTLHEAMRADLEEAHTRGVSVEYIANEFHCSDSRVYKMVRGERPFPLHSIGRWRLVTGGDNAARWLAHELGLAYVPMPRGCTGQIAELAQVVEHQSEAVVTALKIYADSKVDKREACGAVPMCIAQIERAVESQLALIEKLKQDSERALSGPKTMAEAEAV